ncbi:MAG: HAMP domain-containing sensor histidine kinase [Thermodesulfobacteriota bacterium]|nr:HAMP domain-containing sensor histidine kinase [Thermodesulfobacteriota bacterium]
MDTFSAILKRVEQKRKDYTSYSFRKLEMSALNTFFDLAQEYDSLDNLYAVSVAVPRVFFGLHCNLYMVDPKSQAITWVANSHPHLASADDRVAPRIRITDLPYESGKAYVVPIHGKRTPSSRILFHASGDVIGIFEVGQADHLKDAQVFFIQKYVNRIGYNLYNKFLAEQNIQHLKFINNLVADIDHNVIEPNLHYRYYFRRIRKYINRNKEIENELDGVLGQVKAKDPELYSILTEIVEQMVVLNRGMFGDQEKIEQHYKHTSLFLESLLRRDHFLFGEYILRKTPCYLWEDVVLPQFERYRGRFIQQGIAVDPMVDGHEESGDIKVKVDRGLMAQVVANLLSNVEKYAESVKDPSGKVVKAVNCTTSLIKDSFGQGQHGVSLHVYSSGPPLDQENASHVFEEGFRVTERESVGGTGHGLHFVKNVVEVHGGIVGHKAQEHGNEFYLVIPA